MSTSAQTASQLPIVATMQWGVVSFFSEKKKFGFVLVDGKKIFIHVGQYRHIYLGPDGPGLGKDRPPRTPMNGDAVVYWLSDEEPAEGRAQAAAEWSFVSVWNPAMVKFLTRDQPEECESMTEEELLRGLEGLGKELEPDDGWGPPTSHRMSHEYD